MRRRSKVTLYPVIGIPEGRCADNFMRVVFPDGRSWCVGNGRFLLSQTLRLIGIRKAINLRHDGSGHGCAKVDAAVRKRRLQQQNIVTDVRRKAITDVMRQCDRAGAGAIVYREPSLPLRKKTWFSEQGLEWDWTKFLMDLKNVASRRGIEVVKKQYKWKRPKRQRRELPCETCGCVVRIRSRDRFLELVRSGATVRCEQCRAHVLTGTARIAELASEHSVPSLSVRRKVGRGARYKRGLESHPVGRCGSMGYDSGGENA